MTWKLLTVSVLVLVCLQVTASADLIGYWSADSTGGQGINIPNDQGNSDLDGELVEAEYTTDAGGHTGQAGDYAISLQGEDDDYVVIPPTEDTFEEITITAWVNGLQNGDWAGLVVSRDGPQPIGLDFHAFDGTLSYIWNDDSAQTWGFISDVEVPEDEWTFVALTINEDQAVLYAGPQGGALDSSANEMLHFEQGNFTEWRWGEDNCCGGGRNFSGLMDDVSIWNEALSEDDIMALHSGASSPLTLGGGGIEGDFDGSGGLDVADVDMLSDEIVAGTHGGSFDLNGDSFVDQTDLELWVVDLRKTWIGDANLDGEFNSSDFVAVFSTNKYEKDETASWAEGDWNADNRFDTADFVSAFSAGGYEKGPVGAAQAVPEPTSIGLLSIGLLLLARQRS